MDDISSIVKAIQNNRKNPILILNLQRVRKVELLKMHKILHGKKYECLDVILQTPGGDIDAAFLYSKLLRKSAKHINIIVPLYAKSAGTLICLIADNILMTELSELGPLDTQIGETQDGDDVEAISALNGFKALEQVQEHNVATLDVVTKLILSRSSIRIAEAFNLASKFCGETSGTLYQHLNPIKIGEYARALEIGEYYGRMILTRYMKWDEKKATETVNSLVFDYPSHDFAIDCEELVKLGLPAEIVAEDMANMLFLLREFLLKSKNPLIDLIEYTPDLTPPKKK